MLASKSLRLFTWIITASGLASAAPRDIYRQKFIRGTNSSGSNYDQESITAMNTLQTLFYNETSGLYFSINSTDNSTTQLWWNSANCITTLADLTAVDGSVSDKTFSVFFNTFENAQKFNLKQLKITTESLSIQDTCIYPSCPQDSVEPDDLIPTGFINDFFDDDGWWGLAWISVYDQTHEETYLNAAVDIFNSMLANGYNATCGAMWWNTEHQAQNAITNELFLSLAAYIGNRVDNGDYYKGWAKKQWTWFENSGLIQSSGLVVDGLDNSSCVAGQGNGASASYSYNQGVILGGLIELNKLDPNETYIDVANTIAKAAIANLSDANGILTEWNSNGSPNLGGDGATFKGVFARNLQLLQQETGDSDYADFIKKNADSIWSTDRSTVNGTLGNVWDQYFGQTQAQGHCAAMDMLVAAAAIS